MYDYDSEYRRLKEADLAGWGGHRFLRRVEGMHRTLRQLAQRGVLRRPPAHTLELGCGNGASSQFFARRGYESFGVDISQVAIDWAIERSRKLGLRTQYRCGSVCAMPFFEDRFFDIVVDGNCFHCLIGSDRGLCLDEVRRVICDDGIFVVSSMCGIPKSSDAISRFDRDRKYLLEGGAPHRSLLPVEEIEAELYNSGFAIEFREISINPWWDHATIVCRPNLDLRVGDELLRSGVVDLAPIRQEN